MRPPASGARCIAIPMSHPLPRRAVLGGLLCGLLDEPFAALDAGLRDRLRSLLAAQLARHALPLVLVAHDEADVERFGDAVISLASGRVIEQRPASPQRV